MRKTVGIILLLWSSSLYGQQWEFIAPMPASRTNFGFCTLVGGDVMISGGYEFGPPSSWSTFIYDVSNEVWRTTGLLKVPRAGAPLVRLLDDRIFCPSGATASQKMTLSCEIYSPLTGEWELTNDLKQPRYAESAIRLPNGNVLIVGGYDVETQTSHATCELYDPASATVTPTGQLSQWQSGSMLYLDTGRMKVSMLGGFFIVGTSLRRPAVAEEYDIATGTWITTAQSKVPHLCWPQQSVQLPNGDILAPAGGDTADAPLIEIYSPSTQSWRTLGELPAPLEFATSVYIGNDSVLIAGGFDRRTGEAKRTCMMVNIRTGQVSSAPSLGTERYMHRAHVRRYYSPQDTAEITEVIIFGGSAQNGVGLASCEKIKFRRAVNASVKNTDLPKLFRTFYDVEQDQFICIDEITSDHRIDLVNALGQVIFSKSMTADEHRVEVSTRGLPSGVYFFTTTSRSNRISAKVFLSH